MSKKLTGVTALNNRENPYQLQFSQASGSKAGTITVQAQLNLLQPFRIEDGKPFQPVERSVIALGEGATLEEAQNKALETVLDLAGVN